MANTLYDYYGGKLPSITERGNIYRQRGGAGNYIGSAQQNTWLLNALKGGSQGVPAGTVVAPKSELEMSRERSQSARNALQSFIGSYDPVAYLKSLRGEYGIDTAMSGLETINKNLAQQEALLSNLDPDITSRTTGSDTTEAMRRRMIASESEPISRSIGDLSRAKATSQEALNQKLALVDALFQASNLGYSNKLTGYQTEADLATKEYETLAQRQYESQEADKSRTSTAKSASTKKDETKKKNFDEAFNWTSNLYNANPEAKGEDYWTENTAMKELQKKYGDTLSTDELNWILYEARKKTWGN